MNGQHFVQLGAFEPAAAMAAGMSDIFVRRLNSLHPLQAHEAAAVLSLVHEITPVPSHHEILPEGRPARHAMVLLDGLACHFRVLESAQRQITGFVVPGDFCDFGFLSSSPVRETVMSLGPALVGRIDLGQFSTLAEKLPNIALAAMRGASVEQARTRELVVTLGARDALRRLAHFLCEMYTRLSVVGLVRDSGRFNLSMTQADLGEALGLSTVHINRTVQHLRRQKLITMGHGEVTIEDYTGLAALAGFDTRYLSPG